MSHTPKGETRQKVFRFVRDRILDGEPPTVREVQERFGWKTAQTARYHLEKLVDDGKLEVERGRSRGYRLPDRLSTSMIPLLGSVPAGPVSDAVEDLQGYIPVDGMGKDLFALEVEGESMIGAGILPGDRVIVRQQETANPGDIVVARIGDEATVKRFQVKRGKVELHAENPRFKKITARRGEEIVILGKVVEVRRTL